MFEALRIAVKAAVCLLAVLLSLSCNQADSYTPQNGDIIFHTSRSSQSVAIQKATGSPYSHMGIVYMSSGDATVFEAVEPVRMTPLDEWIAGGEDEHFVVKRMTDARGLLTAEALDRMTEAGRQYLGKPYDPYFEWSDDKIYCSELVWKIYKEAVGVEIGQLGQLKDFDLTDEIVKKTIKERYGDAIPLDEEVISPGVMFDSEQLVTVISN